MHLFTLINEESRPVPYSGPVAHLYTALPLGVYTGFVTFERVKFLHLAAHLDRLEASIAEMSWHFSLNRPVLRRTIDQLCHSVHPEAPNLRFRLDVLAARPKSPIIAGELVGEIGRVILAVSPFPGWPAKHYREGVAVATVPALYRENPRAKTADFVLAREAATRDIPAAYEYLLLDEQELMLECSSSNFYAVRDGVIQTAGEGVLEGVTRRIVLDFIRQANLPLHLKAPALADVPLLEEAFLSSSSRGIMPVVRIDEQPVDDSRPGPVTRRLMVAYKEYVAEAIRPAWPMDLP